MSATPLMAQYHRVKKEYPDTILLFRVGDFFETFEEDAKTASKVLGITLTKRASGAAENVALAGFPHHALDTYLPKLVNGGFRVAVCEQVENPKFAKGIVKREVVEVVTPGVAFSEKLLDHKKNNYLASLFIQGDLAGISFSDISTGEFNVYEIPGTDIEQQLSHINPSEVIISKKQKEFLVPILEKFAPHALITKQDEWLFELDYSRDLLLNHFNLKTLKGFGIDHLTPGIIAAATSLNYLRETQKANLPHITKLNLYNPSDYMLLDYSTKRNLEITFTMQDSSREGSLISILDKTSTSMGGRLLKKWISAPLRKLDQILERQEIIEELFINKNFRSKITSQISEISDLERLISKVCTNRANPRELVNIKYSLQQIPAIKNNLVSVKCAGLNRIRDGLQILDELTTKLHHSLNESPPLNIHDGGVIREGYNAELDELRGLSKNAKNWIAALQKSEREKTGIPSLKVGYNRVFGYYIEISNTHKDKVPDYFLRKQTLVNSERYITPELKEYEEKILNAEEKISDLENNLFNDIRKMVALESESIQINGRLIAALDCVISFAECAFAYNYVKPQIDESFTIDIKKGRHPVVERILPPGEKYNPNDCFLDNVENQIIILTGPNMAGKSVYLRQIGLIVLMAQIGSFVPAEKARIGLVDNIFTRVGASDNLAAGESTFLVEMQEAANILNNATNRSLILLDEIGRGTSTFDGISIAWSITEYLHENPNVAAKTLFATHYHELNEMATLFPKIKNYKVDVREHGDKVIFLHRVSPGGADHSYGIQVGQMAGLPLFVTNRAKEILQNLESKELTPYEIKKARLSKIKREDELQINLFELKDDKFKKEISDLPIDNLTPLDALNKLHELKEKAQRND